MRLLGATNYIPCKNILASEKRYFQKKTPEGSRIAGQAVLLAYGQASIEDKHKEF
jgi:hypothetical protein